MIQKKPSVSSIILTCKLVWFGYIQSHIRRTTWYVSGISGTCCPSTPRCQNRPCRNLSAPTGRARRQRVARSDRLHNSRPTVATCRRRQLLQQLSRLQSAVDHIHRLSRLCRGCLQWHHGRLQCVRRGYGSWLTETAFLEYEPWQRIGSYYSSAECRLWCENHSECFVLFGHRMRATSVSVSCRVFRCVGKRDQIRMTDFNPSPLNCSDDFPSSTVWSVIFSAPV